MKPFVLALLIILFSAVLCSGPAKAEEVTAEYLIECAAFYHAIDGEEQSEEIRDQLLMQAMMILFTESEKDSQEISEWAEETYRTYHEGWSEKDDEDEIKLQRAECEAL